MINLTSERLTQIQKGFAGKRIAVVGDLMLDRYFWGKVSRISPEAPVPIVEIDNESTRLGGAANVGVIGLALAYTITAILEGSLLLYMFCRKFPKLRVKEISDSLYKILIASLIMAVLTFIVRQLLGSIVSLQTFWGIFFQLIVSGLVGVATYAITTHFLKSQENKILVDSFLKKFLYPSK